MLEKIAEKQGALAECERRLERSEAMVEDYEGKIGEVLAERTELEVLVEDAGGEIASLQRLLDDRGGVLKEEREEKEALAQQLEEVEGGYQVVCV